MKFDIDIFNSSMIEYDPEKLNNYYWAKKAHSDNAMWEYIYNSEPDNASLIEHFRTWEQESSSPNINVEGSDSGLIVTCKIDYERPDKQLDDHIILMTGFLLKKNVPTICFAQVLVEFTANEGYNMNSGPITNGDIINVVVDFLTQNVKSLPPSIPPQNGIGLNIASPHGWQYFPDIVKANIECIEKAVIQ